MKDLRRHLRPEEIKGFERLKRRLDEIEERRNVMETIGVVLPRELAAKIFSEGIEEDDREAVLSALAGEQAGDTAIVLSEDDASEWRAALTREHQEPVDAELAHRLSGAFALALGLALPADERWTVRQ